MAIPGQFDDAENDDDAFVAMMQSRIGVSMVHTEPVDAPSKSAEKVIPGTTAKDKFIDEMQEEKEAEVEEEEADYDDYDDDEFFDEEDLEFEGSTGRGGGGSSSSVNLKSITFQSSKLNLDDAPRSMSSKSSMSHSVSNSVTKMRRMESSKRIIHTGRDDRATSEQCLDPRTRLMLFRLLSTGVFDKIDGCLSTGKEANVYYAEAGNANISNAYNKKEDEPEISVPEYAVKIYKTSILVFKDRDKYVSGENRWRSGYW